jgi:tetratricopeptide (TPR) repeat protein
MVYGDYYKAIHLFKNLVTLDPTRPIFWSNLGECYWRRAEESEGSNWRNRYLVKALEAMTTSHELDPKSRSIYRSLSQLEMLLGRADESTAWLERGLEANGGPTLADFDLFMDLCSSYLADDRLPLAKASLKRLFDLLPADAEGRKAVAEAMAREGYEWVEVYRYDIALWFLREAHTLSPQAVDADLVQWTSDMRDTLAAADELEQRVIPPIYSLVSLVFEQQKLIDEEMPKEKREEWFKSAISQLDNYSYHEINGSIKFIQQKHPGVYRLGRTLFSKIQALCEEDMNKQPHRPHNSAPKVQQSQYEESNPYYSSNATGKSEGLTGALIGGALGFIAGNVGGALVGAAIGRAIGKRWK